MLGFLKISFVKTLVQNSSIFFSGRFLGQRQKATTFFAKTTQELFLTQLLLFFLSKTS